jgi:hypothetical protein
MSRPWDVEPRYRFILAACAADCAGLISRTLALFGFPCRPTGLVMEPRGVEARMALLGAEHPNQVEDQIRVVANIAGSRDIAGRVSDIAGQTFNLLEHGIRPAPAGAIECLWMVGAIPPSRPAGWPAEYPAKADWPNTFTLEIVIWPEGTDLGKLPAGE